MNTPTDPFFEFGANMVAAAQGVDRDTMLRKSAAAEVLSSAEAEPFHKELCKIAYTAFEVAGEATRPEAILFNNLAKSADWHTSYNRFTDCVLRALAKQDIQKDAGLLLPAVAALHDKTGGGMMKTLTATGALGGAALGSLAFLLSRNAQQSSAANASMLEKVKAYKKLKRDIEEDMGDNGAMEDGEEERYHV